MDQMLFYDTEDALRSEGYYPTAYGYLNRDTGDWFDAPKNDYDLYEILHEIGHDSVLNPGNEDADSASDDY